MRFKEDWKGQLLAALLLFLLAPIAIIFILVAGAVSLFQIPKNKKQYKSSRYYKDLKLKFTLGALYEPEYRFYNAAMRRGLPIRYTVQASNHLEYFIHDGVLYLFPDFEQMMLDDAGEKWTVFCDGDEIDLIDFDEHYRKLIEKIDAEARGQYPVKLLLERASVREFDLNATPPPESVFVTWCYEEAFENENDALKAVIPQSTAELYRMMLQIPDLCGHFALLDGGETVEWWLSDDVRLKIVWSPDDSMISAFGGLSQKGAREITHWHPEPFEILNEVLRIGRRGNVLVLRSSKGSGAVLYAGRAEDCPYSPDHKIRFGQFYYLQAGMPLATPLAKPEKEHGDGL